MVYKNLLGITNPDEMDSVEAEALAKASNDINHEYGAEHCFRGKDICHMHKVWLSKIYEWAGNYRQVNISKGGFNFAMAAQIPKLLAKLETEQLSKYTPCNYSDHSDVIKALVETHIELVLIHPFRDGNGRCSRMLANIMALQAGLPVLDLSSI